MNIRLITRHYWPDSTPGARLHRAILEHLAQQGHKSHVFTAQPSYNDISHARSRERQNLNGVEIQRIALLPERKRWFVARLLNSIYFQLRALWYAFRNPADLLFVSSYPPVVPGICAWLVHRIKGTPYIYHCLDIQPESASLVGKLRSKHFTDFMRRLDRRTCERAAAVVTLSEEMAQTLRNRGWHGKSIRLINNFHTEPLAKHVSTTTPSTVSNREPQIDARQRAFQIVFAGNMGSFQGLDLLIQVAWKLRHRNDIQFVFMGAGERQTDLQRRAGALNGKTIHFISFQTVSVATTVVQDSDLAVVSLLPEVFATAIPSKTMMYLRAGCPILALIEPECALSQLIREHSLGIVPDAREPQAVADAILSACDKSSRVSLVERRRLMAVGETLFGYDRTLDKWSRLIREIDTATAASTVSTTAPASTWARKRAA